MTRIMIDPDDIEQVYALCKALNVAMHKADDIFSGGRGVHPATVAAALRAVGQRGTQVAADDVAALAAALSDPPLPPELAVHAWGERARRTLASDWLAKHDAEQRAVAWDEGYAAACDDERESMPADTENPYAARR